MNDKPAAEEEEPPVDPDSEAFKEKLKSINFGRVPGGARQP